MNNLKNIFLVLSTVISLSAYFVGIRFIFKGSFRPQRTTWFLMAVISALFVATLLVQGDRNAVWLASAIFVGNFLIFLLSIKNGIGGKSKSDMVVLLMVVISLLVWYITKNPLLALVMSIIADFIAFLPTMIKSWFLPWTEEWMFYVFGIVSSFLNLLSLSVFNFEKSIFLIYFLLSNIALVLIIVLRRKYIKTL